MQSPTSEHSNNDHQRRLRRSLKFLFKRLTDDEEYSEINGLQEKRIGDNVVTFEKIESKIWQLRYKTTKEFLDDILSIQTMMKDSSTRVQKIVKGMVDYCKMEIIFIDACDSCYELANSNETKWFSAVCEKSHPLVWAKVLGFPYEPAKLLNIRDKVATVHFFGDYTISQTQTKLCLRFCEKNPNPNYTTTSNIMQEVQEYIKNIGPSFKYAPWNERLSALTPLTASTLNSTHAKLTQTTTVTIEPLKTLPLTAEEDDNKSGVAMMTSPSTWTSTLGRSMKDLLSQNEQQFESLKTNFKLKEAAYRSEIKELEEKLSAQKRQFDEELMGAKNKKYCDFCKSATETTVNIFCGNECGAAWYTEQAKIEK